MSFTEVDHKEFNMEDFKKRQRAAKIQAAIDAVAMTTPGDWWIDGRGELLNDGMGNFKLGKGVGGGAPLWDAANRKVIAASRELAEEVVRLRALVKESFEEGTVPDDTGFGKSWETSYTKCILEDPTW